ncbi:MAG TPA: type II toxin-antitoxin system VapC family toxin [Longimicrobium sp.]|nr:type II toxin-antitoxin system VapC family toxin [Longimicrobium sp.]
MRFLLDTNTLSEATRDRPDAGVQEWIKDQPEQELAVSVLSLGEIRRGFLLLPDGRKESRLIDWLQQTLAEQFDGRVLSVDEPIAMEWGRLTAEGKRKGRRIPEIDALLVATAVVRDLVLVSRNERHLAGWGPHVINPWSEKSRD